MGPDSLHQEVHGPVVTLGMIYVFLALCVGVVIYLLMN